MNIKRIMRTTSVVGMGILAVILWAAFFVSAAEAANYCVPDNGGGSCSGTVYADLQAALDTAAADGGDSVITLTQEQAYDGPFVIPYNETARTGNNNLTITGAAGLDREKVVLHNPTGEIPLGFGVSTVVGVGFYIDKTVIKGMPVKLEHLTVAAAHLLENGSFEGTYSGGLAPSWITSGNITATENAYTDLVDPAQDVNVLSWYETWMDATRVRKSQGFSSAEAGSCIYTTITGLNIGQPYVVTAWVKRTGGSGNLVLGLEGAEDTTASSASDVWEKIFVHFQAASGVLKLKFSTDVGTSGVVDDAAVSSYITAGVLFKGPTAGVAVQEVTDCVIRNIGSVLGALDDPNATVGDDPHGHAIAVFNKSNPEITDCDIRDNYDGVMMWDPSGYPNDPSKNPRLYTKNLALSAGDYQRIRLNSRFGVGARVGASPYIGPGAYMGGTPGYYLWDNANIIHANGYANVAARDGGEPRVQYNSIEGSFNNYYFNERNISRFGVIAKDNGKPKIIGNLISDHNWNGVAARDESEPVIGPDTYLTDRSCTDNDYWNMTGCYAEDVNQIYDNNKYAGLPASDSRHIGCSYALAENIYCAAVGTASGSRPKIQNNHIYANGWVGIGNRDWSVPTIRGNWVLENIMGIGMQTVRPSVLSESVIQSNLVYGNRQGIVMINCGTPLSRVKVRNNDIVNNYHPEKGVGISISGSYVEITDNKVSSNGRAGAGIGHKVGIGMRNGSDAIISDNRILNNKGVGVGVRDSAATITNNLMVDNWGAESSAVVYAGDGLNYVENGAMDGHTYVDHGNGVGIAPDWFRRGSITASRSEDGRICTAGNPNCDVAQAFGEGSPDTSYLFQIVPVMPGVEYQFSAWLKTTSGTAYIRLAEPEYASVYTTLSAAGSTYTEKTYTFTSISKMLYVRIYGGVAASCLADDISLSWASPGSLLRAVNNNIMIPERYQNGYYSGYGVKIEGTSEAYEIKGNIIGRCRLGVYAASPATVDPGAVDGNLVYAWEAYPDNEGPNDGYVLNGEKPGENTHYYGEYFGAGPTHHFMDADHNNGLVQDYEVNASSPIYTFTPDGGCLQDCLGLAAGFNYPPADYGYYRIYSGGVLPTPAADGVSPVLVSINPPEGSVTASSSTSAEIVAFIQDAQGDGINRSAILMDVSIWSAALGDYSSYPGTTTITPGDTGYSQYKLSWSPLFALPCTNDVKVKIEAQDVLSNSLITSLAPAFTTENCPAENVPPTMSSILPPDDPGCTTPQWITDPIAFHLEDAGTGVDIEAGTMRVTEGLTTLYNGPVLYYAGNTPIFSDYTVFYRPASPLSYSTVNTANFVTVEVTPQDFNGNSNTLSYTFCTESDTYPPAEAAFLRAASKGSGAVFVGWEHSVDNPDIDPEGDLDHYVITACYAQSGDVLSCQESNYTVLAEVPYGYSSWELVNLPPGQYKLRLTAVDSAGNENRGIFANTGPFYPYGEPVEVIDEYFYDDFDGFSDGFDVAGIVNWISAGSASWTENIAAGQLEVSGAAGELEARNFFAGDFVFNAEVVVEAGEAAYLLLRKIPGSDVSTSGYAAFVDRGSNTFGFWMLSASGNSEILSTDFTAGGGDTFLMKVTGQGNSLTLELSGTGVSGTPSANYAGAADYASGNFGLWQNTSHTIEYNYVELKDLPHYWTSAGTGNWDTGGTLGGDYEVKSLGIGYELLIKNLVAPENFIYQADVRFTAEDSAAGLLFQKQIGEPAGESAYAAYLATTAGADYIHFYRLESGGGGLTLINSTTSVPLSPNTDYHIKITGTGGDMALYLSSTANKPYDYERALAAQDSATPIWSGGGVGFWQPSGTPVNGLSTRYDNALFGETAKFYIPAPETGGTEYSVTTALSYTDIQSAIDHASPGDYLKFADGVYNIGADAIALADGVSIICSNAGGCTIRGSGDMVLVGGNNSTVEGFKISGISKMNTCIYCSEVAPLIINNEIYSCQDGMRIGGTAGVAIPTITINNIHDNSRMGIGNSLESEAWILENRIWANALNGVGVRHNARPRIEDNIIGSSGDPGTPWSSGNGYVGVGAREYAQTWIGRNELQNNYYSGIGNQEYAEAIVEANNIHDNEYHGLSATDWAKPYISAGNLIYNNADRGISLSGDVSATIINNAVWSNTGTAGIGIQGNVAVTISRNLIYAHNGVGIGFGSGAPAFTGTAEITGNELTNNSISSTNAGGVGGKDLSGAVVSISNNKIFSSGGRSAIGFINTAGDSTVANLTISNNILDNNTVTSDGKYGIEIKGGSGYTVVVNNNDLRNFGYSGMRFNNFVAGSSLSIRNNTISTCGAQDYVYADQSDMGDGTLCSDADGCTAASGIQFFNSVIVSGTVINNTVRYNLYSGFGLWGTEGYIGPGNDIYENGNLYTLPGPGLEGLCPTCVSLGAGATSGDGGISVRDLALGKEVWIYETTPNAEIYGNHIGDVRVKPGTQGFVYLNDNLIPAGSGGGQLQGFGLVMDCFEPSDALPGGECNTTISGTTFSGNDRYGILVRGPYSNNLIFSGNTIENNMITSNTNNVICSDDPAKKDHVGGGIALTCGARPVIKNNIIRSNGADRRPLGKGSHAGITMWEAGDAHIYGNQIYNNASDGIGMVGTPNPAYTSNAPQIGTSGANYIYNNGRYGIALITDLMISSVTATKASIKNNEVYSNPQAGIGANQIERLTIGSNNIHDNGDGAGTGYGIAVTDLENGQIVSMYGNTVRDNTLAGIGIGVDDAANNAGTIYINGNNQIIDNGIYSPGYNLGGGIALRKFAGTAYIDGNTIASNAGSGKAAGGIGINSFAGGAINIGTLTGNTIRYNVGGADAGELRCGGIGGLGEPSFDTGTLTIEANNIYGNNSGGIGLDDFKSASFNVYIRNNNQIHNNDKGIRLRNVANSEIFYNHIFSNGDGTDADCGVPLVLPDSGILIRETAGAGMTTTSAIKGNIIEGNRGRGISISDLTSGDNVTITSNTIGGSTLELGNTMGGVNIGICKAASNDGTITVDNSVHSNIISNNGRSGISFYKAAGVTIQNNLITYNGRSLYHEAGVYDASGVRAREVTLTGGSTIYSNIISYNTYSGVGAFSSPGTLSGNTITWNGSGADNCTDIFGSAGGDGGVSVRYLALGETLIVTNNVIEDNILNSVSCNPDTDGAVRFDGTVVACGVTYWDKNDTRVYVVPNGVYVDGVLIDTSNTQVYSGSKTVIDCTNIASIPNPVTGGTVWGVAILGGVKNIVVRNCTIENNQVLSNDLGPGGTSMGGGVLIGPGVEAEVYNNDIRYNGSGPAVGSNSAVIDGDTTTEWKTHPGDLDEPHWFMFTLGSNTQISSIRLYTGNTNIYTWNVYFGPSNMWMPDFQAPKWDSYKIITDVSVGGTPGWVKLDSENPTANQRRLWIEITGGSVTDHLYELEYNKVGSGWLTPDLGTQASCSNLKAGNAGVIIRCTSDTDLRNNKIYSNANNAIEARGAIGTIGPDNEIYSQGKRVQFGIWSVAVMDYSDLTIFSNKFYDNNRALGMNYAGGDVTITSNDFYNFVGSGNQYAIGVQALVADLNLNIRNNKFRDTPRLFGISMEQNRDHYLNFTLDNNSFTNGRVPIKIRYIDNADIMISNNTITDNDRLGMQLNDNDNTNITVSGNLIQDNRRTGIRFQQFTGSTFNIVNNDILGNAWGPPNDNTRDNLHFKLCEDSSIIISGNTISNSVAHPTVQWDGINFKDGTNTNVTISYNTISNHPESGIEFKNNIGGGYVNIRHNNITYNDLIGVRFEFNVLDMTKLYSNEISYNGIGSASSDWGGIWFQSNDNVWVEKNWASYNTGIAFRFQDSSNVFIGWEGWDPLNFYDVNNPNKPASIYNIGSADLGYCYPFPAGDPQFSEGGSVPYCKYASNARSCPPIYPGCDDYFDPDCDHTWLNSDLWDSDLVRRQPGTNSNVFYGNTSWAIQIGAIDDNVDNVMFRGNVVAGNGGPGFGFKAENGYTNNSAVYANTITGNPGGDGIQVVNSGGQSNIAVINTRVVGGDAVQAKWGGHLDVWHGNHYNIKLRIDSGSAEVYNYNYIGCINQCTGGQGGTGKGAATYNMHHYNCIGGHVPFDNDYMDIHDHNWFYLGDTFEVHEGGGFNIWNGNRAPGGHYRKNHSGPWGLGDNNQTEPNYFVGGFYTGDLDGSGASFLKGNWCGGGGCWLSNAGGRPLPPATCNYGLGGGGVPCSGNLGWAGSCGDPDPACTYWSGPNAWINFCEPSPLGGVDRNCTAPNPGGYW